MHRNPCLVLGCTDEEALKAAFSPFGAIESVFSPKGQKFSFVKFEDKYAAENAMTALNGTEIGGRPVQVRLFLFLLLLALPLVFDRCADSFARSLR